MKLLSKRLIDRRIELAERVKAKHADKLLTHKVPVSVREALELGLQVSDEAKAKLAEVEKLPRVKGVREDAVTVVLFADYYRALLAYSAGLPATNESQEPVDA